MVSSCIHTQTAEIYRYNENVLVLRFFSDKLIKLNHAKEIDHALVRASNGKQHFLIVDALDVQSSMTAEAQHFLSQVSHQGRFVKKVAIVLNNLPVRLTASVFIKFHKPEFPAKIVESSEEALEWFNVN